MFIKSKDIVERLVLNSNTPGYLVVSDISFRLVLVSLLLVLVSTSLQHRGIIIYVGRINIVI